MKTIHYILLVSVLVIFGCSDRLDKEFQNPDKHNPRPEEIIPGMFTQMLTTRFYVLDYGEGYWAFNSGFGIPAYTQLAVRRPSSTEASYYSDWDVLDGKGNFTPNMNMTARFERYFTDLKNWGLMRDEVEGLTETDLADNELFFLMATVIKDAIGLQMVDLFNRIPYTEAFQGTKGVFFPKYDHAEDIYKIALDDLADLAIKIPVAYNQMSQRAKDSFIKQDIAFGGDVQLWVQYINSIRLRHAVRMSGVNIEFAKQHIQAVLSDLPAKDLIWPNTQLNENRIGTSAGGIYARAIYEHAYNTLIPNTILQRMSYGGPEYVEGEDDPRLPVIATPTRYSKTNWQFGGCSMDYDSQYPYWSTKTNADNTPYDAGIGLTFRTFINYPTNVNSWLRSGYSQYNIGTYTFGNLPSYMNSQAENDLFLAEIELKGMLPTGKSASEHIRDAVIHSTDFWYRVNGYSTFFEDQVNSTDSLRRVFKPEKPSASLIAQFADKIKAEFDAADGVEGKMDIIMQQKYIHFNILGIYELWSELRRTRRPKLEKLKVLTITYSPVVERMMYPASEMQNNSNNYNEVVHENDFITPIFWVPESKKTEDYYRSDYLPLIGFKELPDPNPNKE